MSGFRVTYGRLQVVSVGGGVAGVLLFSADSVSETIRNEFRMNVETYL
jgi:hypothetical protein